MRLSTLAGLSAVLAVGALPASAQDVPIIEVEYQKAQLGADGVWAVVETGTHLFADDGRYRLDRRIGGETLTRIRIPVAGERIEINHALGIGMRGPDEGAFTIPAEGPMLSRSRRSATAPFEGIQMTSIGTKARGPLLLQGFSLGAAQCLTTWECELEVWIYAPRAVGARPEVLERTIRQTRPDGTELTSTTVITSSERTTTDGAAFAPPADIPIRDRW